jgi:hypothetical protein
MARGFALPGEEIAAVLALLHEAFGDRGRLPRIDWREPV